MAEDIVLNFGGDAAEPVSTSGPRFDRLPPGPYMVKPALEAGTTSTDKPVANATITISRGPLKGKKVRDSFVLPRAGTDDSPFGQRRLHGLVVATGIKPLSGKKIALSKILAAVSGRECLAVIDDGEMPASGNYAARLVSQPVAYWSVKSKEGQKLLKEMQGDTEDAIDDEAEEAVDSEEEETEAEEEEAPKPKWKKAAPVEEEEEEEEPAPKKKAKKADDESVDDLFDDE